MSNFNKVILVGRLAGDPELRYTSSGKAVASFRLAVSRPQFGAGRDANQKETADFFSVTAWEKLAETCGRYLAKGKLVLIEGRLQNRSYTANDGTQRTVTEIIANDMRMLGPKSGGGGGMDMSDVPHPADEPVAVGAPRERRAPTTEALDDVGMDDIPF